MVHTNILEEHSASIVNPENENYMFIQKLVLACQITLYYNSEDHNVNVSWTGFSRVMRYKAEVTGVAKRP